MDVTGILFSLISSVLTDIPVDEATVKAIDTDSLRELYAISNKHDIAHIVGEALSKIGKLGSDEVSEKFRKKPVMAVYRYERSKLGLAKICDALEKEHIPFMPLKGAVLREYYPNPWMRTSCDLDILVPKELADRAAEILVDSYGYHREHRNSHEITLSLDNGTHIELHYELIEDWVANASSKILADVWERSTLNEGYSYWHTMPDELFYFYHIAHMAKHFERGGCGIRTFIDLYILDNMGGADKDKRDVLLGEGEMLRFAEAARKLSRVWFKNEPHDEISEKMENYILHGGIYGTLKNSVSVQQNKQGGRVGYAFSKIFLPYNLLRFHYPILEKHRWLTPVMEVRRWGRLIFCGHAKRSLDTLKLNKNLSKAEASDMQKFMDSIGL